MKKIIPLLTFGVILIYFVGLISFQNTKESIAPETKTLQEPPLSSLVPKETPTIQKPTATTPQKTPTTTPATKPTTSTPSPTNPTQYTMSVIATHNSSSSCWTVVNNNVYDLTSFINQHPGGSGAIKRLCGKDGTSSFEDQHGGERRPEQELADNKIGTLKS